MTPAIGSTTSFRADIEGLRAVALGAVLLGHAGIPFATGGYVGVDVFFVISGFLITRLLITELSTTGSISLRRFWARRMRRLLPAALVVLVAVAISARLLLPAVRQPGVSGDELAAAAYVSNWRFASQA